MKTRIFNFDKVTTEVVLSKAELQNINGGGFAYDFAFALRELVNYVKNGGGAPGLTAAAADLGLNYRPIN